LVLVALVLLVPQETPVVIHPLHTLLLSQEMVVAVERMPQPVLLHSVLPVVVVEVPQVAISTLLVVQAVWPGVTHSWESVVLEVVRTWAVVVLVEHPQLLHPASLVSLVAITVVVEVEHCPLLVALLLPVEMVPTV
jgi:hypothetical protein